MDTYMLSLAFIGFIGLSMSWVPPLSRKIGLSYSVVYLALGLFAYSLFSDLPWANPFQDKTYTTHLTELIVIVALMSTGLRIDRKLNWKLWRAPLRLVSVLMLLSIIALGALGYWFLGLGAASALLLGAAMAPTDPVLASDVQVGPPRSEKEDDIKFSLTAEAGMNDGLAFPFTWLAIVVAGSLQTGEPWFWEWLARDVLYRIAVGLICGFVLGRLVAYLFFTLPRIKNMTHIRDGLVALSSTLFVYGITELIHGYGFIAVFVAALTMRNYEKNHHYHERLHDFIDQVERILLGTLLLLFGGSLIGGILDPLTWKMAGVGLIFVFLIRPLGCMISLLGLPLKTKDKLIISFFGIKGVGSFYYLSFALEEETFPFQEELWALAAFIVLISILVHGLTAVTVMKSQES